MDESGDRESHEFGHGFDAHFLHHLLTHHRSLYFVRAEARTLRPGRRGPEPKFPLRAPWEGTTRKDQNHASYQATQSDRCDGQDENAP